MTPGVAAGNGNAGGVRDLSKGAILQCVEAATLGMPFEVWKTRMGRYRKESTIEAFQQIYKQGGVQAYWRGLAPKLVESASKGAVLLYSKECILSSMRRLGASETLSGFAAGAGGGICQTAVMGPCTYVVTALVTGGRDKTHGGRASDKIREVWRTKGVKGFYSGGTAIALRQATNWASRQGFTEWVRTKMKGGDERAKLSKTQEVAAGIVGGTLSTWNQPFEVARIQMQAAANEGKQKHNILQVFRTIVVQEGVQGLFKGVIPRIGLGIWQTLFMVTGAKLLKDSMNW
ncbi:MGC79800 protein, related [Neospora caninum Liverpool]|uniref:MGC79800 protein, related n=1 Tax=Neospora caninum (strain Liverpool) TaxID=572307 RepID=F0VR10_NEOCL|nr:MGC79800 protein, related [Neospora caninum Liverpool]CBZ56157.1 MGC79800 protein, related [Neospora caninum Liverpool]CEL70914.1 TPA: MGC79800 protein, related [Neospora caninum Liverpool]|eukprot:XP_003886183.1 MGC79800 protein, related [Neospora caninum Liverpool]